MAQATIPSVDIESHSSDIPDAIASLGFLFLQSPSVPSPSSVEHMFNVAKEFFIDETPEDKEKVTSVAGRGGWIKPKQENLDFANRPGGDVKEAFNMRLFDGNDKAQQPLPPTLSTHEHEIAAFMRSCHELCMRVLEALAIALDIPKDFFTSRHSYDKPQGTVLRFLYYPPTDLREGENQGEIRAGAHSDYGSITLLFQKDVGGLQVLLPPTKSSQELEWIDAPVVKDAVLVNIGDVLDFWTGGKFKSNIHRVTLPRSEEEAKGRYSIAFFLHPDDDVLLSKIVSKTNPSDVEALHQKRSAKERFGVDPNEDPVTAGEWLKRRLNATYSH